MNKAQLAVLEQMLARAKTRAQSTREGSTREGEKLWFYTYIIEPLEDVLEIRALECARPITDADIDRLTPDEAAALADRVCARSKR